LLTAGVRIFELQASVLHAKTGVIDGAWSTVGSANIDIRSFLHNSEINVVVLDEGFGKAMEPAFQDDLKKLQGSHEAGLGASTGRRAPEGMGVAQFRLLPLGACAAEEPRLQCARNRSILKSPTAPRGPPWACRCSQTVLGFRTFRFAAF
jgi:phosphatidylserine/phosphatidylglycerophosphate/cardiolipin synthase-like enzyme